MSDIQALVFEFISRHKSVIQAFDEDKLERYIESMCRSYYGCACGDFHLMTSPNNVEIGFKDSREFKLTPKEMCEYITDFLMIQQED